MAPSRQSARWQVAAWDRFEMELATALDETYADWTIEFFPMLLAKNGPSDDYAAARIVSQMSNRWRVRDNIWRPTESKLIESIQRADLVITQRFHGVVLASILSTPFVGISAHDKMRSFFTDSSLNNYCDYYSFTRESLAQATDAIPALYRFARLREESHARWHMLAQEIEDRLSTSEVIPLTQMTNPKRL
jgi:polysaccharide pyruvyl transferase WcaK-like protein